MGLLDWDEFHRWLRAAEHALESARRDASLGDHEWACFKAEQAAQLAVKALHRLAGKPAWGHDLLALYREASKLFGYGERELEECSRLLGRLYVPTRYPDALPGSLPHEYFSEADSEKAIMCAEKIIGWVSDAAERARREEAGERGEA